MWGGLGTRRAPTRVPCAHGRSGAPRNGGRATYTRLRINRHLQDFKEGKLLNLAITLRSDHSLIGAIGLVIKPEQDVAELGYWVGKPWWGQGYATEAAQAIVDHGFRKLGLARIYAQCFSRNPASARVLEKAGMVKEGHLRKHFKKWDEFVDIEVFGVLREEREGKP